MVRTRRPGRALRAVLLGTFLPACTGAVEDGRRDDGPGGTPTNPTRPGTPRPDDPMTPGPTGPGTTAPPTSPPPAGACQASTLLPARVWRLSPAQYAATMKQLFNYTVAADALPADGVTKGSFSEFDTGQDGAVVHDRLAVAYRDTAARASQTIATAALETHACLKATPRPAGCVDAFLADQVGRAFRRPLLPAETQRFASLFDASATKWGAAVAARLVMQAALQSPNFLYRTELGTGSKGRVALTQHELASALAYTLTDAPPDGPLLTDANMGRLDAATARKHAERLVATEPARRKTVDFLMQLLHVSKLARGQVTKDAKLFPTWKDALAQGMLGETRTFLEKQLAEGGGAWTSLFTADHSYVNAALATHYGITATGLTTELKKTTLPAARRGVLAHASVLSTLSDDTHTSPTHRGLLYLQGFLCQAVPDPPPDAADQASGKLISPDAKATQREHFQFAVMNAPECSACHSRFMPFGLGLERFDPIGRYRETENDRPIDPSVTLRGFGPLDGTYRDGLEAGEKVAASAAGQRCLVAQAATWGLGQEIPVDGCGVDRVATKVGASGMKLTDLLVELTQSELFTHRQNEI